MHYVSAWQALTHDMQSRIQGKCARAGHRCTWVPWAYAYTCPLAQRIPCHIAACCSGSICSHILNTICVVSSYSARNKVTENHIGPDISINKNKTTYGLFVNEVSTVLYSHRNNISTKTTSPKLLNCTFLASSNREIRSPTIGDCCKNTFFVFVFVY